jgi:hypothetical protein
MTRHDWIFDVLKDLRTYAQANGLPALAAKADEALHIARAEISAADPQAETGSGGSPPSGRAH